MQVRQTRDELTAFPERTARFWWGWAGAFALSGLLVLLATLPPFVGPKGRMLLMQGFSSVCHQIPGRSPAIDGVPLAVCHRCYGIYAALPLAVLGFLALARWEGVLGRHAPAILACSLVPAGLDWLFGVFGLWHNTPVSRLLTGGLFGLAAGYHLARAFTQATSRRPLATAAAAGSPGGGRTPSADEQPAGRA